MSSSIHFRFKSARQFETLTFEGDFLKVADLKVAIVERKKLNFGEGFDLEISDTATNEVQHDESALIQKNSSVIVRRVPGLKPGGILSQQEMAAKNERYAESTPNPDTTTALPDPPAHELPNTIEGDDEADRIASLISQSNNAIDLFGPPPPRGRYNNRGQYRGGRGGRGGRGRTGRNGFGNAGNNPYSERAPRPSSNYVCHRCNKPGHWIDLCPTNGDPNFDKIKVRAPTGIPRSMLRQVDAPESGTGLQDSSGQFVTLQPNEEEFARQTVGLRVSQAAAAAMEKGESTPTPIGIVPVSADQSKDAEKKGAEKAQGTDQEIQPSNENPNASKDAATGDKKTVEVTRKSGQENPTGSHGNVSRGARDRFNSSNGSRPGGGHNGNARAGGRHVNRNNGHGRGMHNTRAAMSRMANMPPMPPPGFVPPPPFPPSVPPPHLQFAAFAAYARQHGLPFPPPGMFPPNMVPPMPPGMMNDAGRNGLEKDTADASSQQAFQNFMTMMHGQGPKPADGDEKKQSTPDNSDSRRAGDERDGKRSPGKSKYDNTPSAVKEGDGREGNQQSEKKESTELNGSRVEGPVVAHDIRDEVLKRKANHNNEDAVNTPVERMERDDSKIEPDLDRSKSERLESPQKTSESQLSRDRTNPSAMADDVRKREDYENENDGNHAQRNMKGSRNSRRPSAQQFSPRDRSLSPRRRSPFSRRMSPRGFRRSPPRRGERVLRGEPRDGYPREIDPSYRGRDIDERRNRDGRRGRDGRFSPPPFDRYRDGPRSPPRSRHYGRSHRSPSPPRDYRESRGRHARSSGRRNTPPGKRRYDDYRSHDHPSPRRGRRDYSPSPPPYSRSKAPRRGSRFERSPPRSPPRGGRSPPRGMRSPPRGMRSSPRRMRSPPRGMRSPPRGGRSPPRGMRSPPRGGRSPPRVGRSPPRVGRSPPRVGRSPPRVGRSPPRVGRSPPRVGRSPPRGGRSPPRGMRSLPRGGRSARYNGRRDDSERRQGHQDEVRSRSRSPRGFRDRGRSNRFEDRIDRNGDGRNGRGDERRDDRAASLKPLHNTDAEKPSVSLKRAVAVEPRGDNSERKQVGNEVAKEKNPKGEERKSSPRASRRRSRSPHRYEDRRNAKRMRRDRSPDGKESRHGREGGRDRRSVYERLGHPGRGRKSVLDRLG